MGCCSALIVCLLLGAPTFGGGKVAGPQGPYLVLVDPGKEDEFLPAAEAMAALHDATVKRFDPHKLDDTLAELRSAFLTGCFPLQVSLSGRSGDPKVSRSTFPV